MQINKNSRETINKAKKSLIGLLKLISGFIKGIKLRDWMFTILICIIILFSIINLLNDYSNFIKMNVGNSITLIIGCFFSYFITQQKIDKRILITAQEKTLDQLVDISNDVFKKFKDKQARDEVLIKLKSCDLKIIFIGSFQKKLKIDREYTTLLCTFNQFNEFVSRVSDNDLEITKDLQAEILSLLIQIESNCTTIKTKLILF